MKKILHFMHYLILGTIFFSAELFSQNPIPNPGLESWSGNVPNGWSAPANIPQASIEPITKSPEAYGDSWAARGFVLEAFGATISPILYTGSLTEPFFPVSANHLILSCFYKFFSVGGDMLFIEVVFLNQTIGGGGEGHAMISTNNDIYSKIEISITYDNENPPGWQAEFANITITILPQEGQDPHAGTWFLVDNFTFDNLPITLDVKEVDNQIPTEFKLEQNFPNPFNPATNIKFSIPEESFVNLRIYNLQGEEVATLVKENLSAGTYQVDWNAEEMPSGVYFYTVNNQAQILSNKMLLIK